jgi:hypothetical protein
LPVPGTGVRRLAEAAWPVSGHRCIRPCHQCWPPSRLPNVIRLEYMADPRKEQSAVAAGRADLVNISDEGLPYSPLAIRYPARVHSGLKLLRQLRPILRSSRRPAGERGAGGAAGQPSRRPKTVGTSGPRRHRPGPLGPDLQSVCDRVRLRPGRELPGIPGLRPAARPDLGPVAPHLAPRRFKIKAG